MNRFHRTAAVASATLVALISTGLGILAANPAFAMRQIPPGDSGVGAPIQVVTHTGWSSWETALVAIAAAAVAALLTAAAMRAHARRPAASLAR